MVFGNRYGKNNYELLRYCGKLNTDVTGGILKIFKYFIDNYNPKEISAYVDRSFNQGKLYEILGFNVIKKIEPNYHYIIDRFRCNRFNFRKNILVKDGYDSNKSEHQIMLDRKIYRIYDSGNLKYKMFI